MSGASLLLFVVYFLQLFANGANLSNISFWGFMFTVNYLAVLGVIVAFWIEINLVNTLWILLAISPVTVFTMNMGLDGENCHVSGFFRSKNKKD